jgi:broad specificity phosphatase PhoE
VAVRLVLVAAAETTGTRQLVFGDRSDLARPDEVTAEPHRTAAWGCGPEPACRQTAARLGGAAEVIDGLADLDVGRWAGRGLAQVGAEDPEDLGRWLSDANAAPHGGESLAELAARVGACCDAREWLPGRNLVVVAPLVARALVAHALEVGPQAIFRVDLAPLGRVVLSRQGTRWRLQQLGRPEDP